MPLPALLRFLHTAPAEGVSDADLLRRFAAVRDEAAFELLVRRHADLVWKVCRRVLRQEADAEDAFQATFVALARKAGSVRGACVAGWLHRVALHAALKFRAKAARSATAELPDVPAPVGPDPALAVAVHEELGRLSDRYRLPVLLCDLEGHTHAEAAKVLGWPVGTVSGRLSRGRDRLRTRLERRGVVPVNVAAVLVGTTRESPATLVRAAVTAATGGASAAVASLAEGVIMAIRIARLKVLAAVVLVAVGFIGTGAVVVIGQDKKPAGPVPGGMPDNPAPTAFPDIKPLNSEGVARFMAPRAHLVRSSADDPPAIRLNKAKLRLAVQAVHYNFQLIASDRFDDRVLPGMARAVRDAADAAAELWPAVDDRRPWLEMLVGVQLEVELYVMARARAGTGPNLDAGPVLNRDVITAQSARMDAELSLLKLGPKK
jgi:RNA polymerase sigma factor (sigma-70 family)